MLRVRPILNTPHADAWKHLLVALSMQRIDGSNPGAQLALGTDRGHCFAAGAGRVLVREAEVFGVALGFEVRDVQRFAEWTISDGTPVALREQPTEGGPVLVAHLAAPDGLAIEARPVDPTLLAGTSATRRPAAEQPRTGFTVSALSVVPRWQTPDVPGACSTLENIGAKLSQVNSVGTVASYRAKHGGFVDVFNHSQPRVDLALEYAGPSAIFEEHMAMAGYKALTLEYGDDSTVCIEHPDGGQLQVACRSRDWE